MTSAGLEIVDAQVHLVPRRTAERPWCTDAETFHGWREFSAERMLADMDAAGVARAVVVPTSAVDGYRNDVVLAAAAAHPHRFSVVVRVDLEDRAAARALLRECASSPAVVGLRAVFRPGVGRSARWLEDGTAAWFWPEAEAAGVPLYVHAPGQVRRLHEVAAAHPRLRMAIDHVGMSADVRAGEIDAAFADVVALAHHPSVSVKASALACIAPSKISHRLLRRRMEEVVAAFGPARVYWGSDITRLPCSYRESIDQFLDAVSFLPEDDLALVMGRALSDWLGLDREPEQAASTRSSGPAGTPGPRRGGGAGPPPSPASTR